MTTIGSAGPRGEQLGEQSSSPLASPRRRSRNARSNGCARRAASAASPVLAPVHVAAEPLEATRSVARMFFSSSTTSTRSFSSLAEPGPVVIRSSRSLADPRTACGGGPDLAIVTSHEKDAPLTHAPHALRIARFRRHGRVPGVRAGPRRPGQQGGRRGARQGGQGSERQAAGRGAQEPVQLQDRQRRADARLRREDQEARGRAGRREEAPATWPASPPTSSRSRATPTRAARPSTTRSCRRSARR